MPAIVAALFAVLLGLVSLPTYVAYQQRASQAVNAAGAAQQALQFNAAVSSYVQQNAGTLQATATATLPVTITLAALQGGGFLPASFNSGFANGQTLTAQVLQPTAGNLQVFAMTTGGTPMSDALAMSIAKNIGNSGGIVPQNDSGIYPGGAANAYGAFGWGPISTARYTGIAGGHIVSLLTFNNGQLNSTWLARNAIPGQPQLNTMNTPIIMASVQTPGAVCATTGSIAQDGSGKVLSCVNDAGSLTWQYQASLYWRDPVMSYAGLEPCTNANAYQTRIVKSPYVGYGPRAYTCNGWGWQALAVDDSGNLLVPGALTVTGDASAKTVTPTLAVADNSSCVGYPTGAIAQSNVTAGLVLSCQSGVWKGPASGMTGTWHNVGRGAGTYLNNTGRDMIWMYHPAMPHSSFYTCYAYVDGSLMWYGTTDLYAAVSSGTSIPVPAGSTYYANCPTAIWQEYY